MLVGTPLITIERMGATIDMVKGSIAGFIVGAVVNCTLNYRLTFRSDNRHREAMPKLLAVAGSGLVLNGLLMAGLVGGLGVRVQYMLAQVGVTDFLVF